MLGKKKHKKEGEVKSKKVMSIQIRDYSNDPFVIKKVESSKKVFEKYGFPKELMNG
jgi:hypothetical protein